MSNRIWKWLRTGLTAMGMLWSGVCAWQACLAAVAVQSDVLPEYDNRPVTALSEDCESVRMALGAGMDDALACRSLSGYLRGWGAEEQSGAAEQMIKRAAREFERMYAIDHGIISVRFARDTRDEPKLAEQVKFWRNELALAAKQVQQYAADAAALKAAMTARLKALAAGRQIVAERVAGRPWADADREAWRKAGAMTGVRLPLDPYQGSPAEWWNRNLSLAPGYLVTKHALAGDTFFSAEKMIGAWGANCTAEGHYDWDKLNGTIKLVRDRGGKFLLELPTLQEQLTDDQVEAQHQKHLRRSDYICTLYAPPLPTYLAQDRSAALLARNDDGTMRTFGGVQLFNPAVARAYGEYLSAMAENLRRQGLYQTIAAVHLEMGEAAELDEQVDYSDFTRQRWQAFLGQRYGNISALNSAAGTSYRSFHDVHLPVRMLQPRAAKDWQESLPFRWHEFLKSQYGSVRAMDRALGTAYKKYEEVSLGTSPGADAKLAKDWQVFVAVKPDGDGWHAFLTDKYGPKNIKGQGPAVNVAVKALTWGAIRAALGDDYHEGDKSRLPFDYPPVIKIEYLHFRQAWVKDYLAIKRKLVATAFPDKLLIEEMRQLGDHEGIAGISELKWGGFTGDDIAQFSGVGAENEHKPFMIRTVGPVGFGTRPSDSIESLYRDYLWINFRNPGNLLRYFYAWVAHGYMDYQFGWQGITNHWLTNQSIYELGPTVANTAPQPQRIGLLLPRATFDLFEGSIYYEYLGWDWLLNGSKLAYTRIDEHFIREGKLKDLGLQVLILPDVRAMDDKVVSEIERWVHDGGLLVVSGLPGELDEYGRQRRQPALEAVLGVRREGTVSEAVQGTPLTITIPRGIHSGGWPEKTNRRPEFETLRPTTARVLSHYEGGKAAITLNSYGKGRAVTMGYPFGREAVEADRCSIGFYRTYTFMAREPQLVARTAWLRKFIVDELGYRPEYGVDYAVVGRFQGKEAHAMGLSVPKGFSQTPGDWFYVYSEGDPRPGHELPVERETPDMALRFFPRQRDGVATRYLGISTREVHYIGPRGAVQMVLAPHTYKVRINNPKIQAIWDVGRDVPVGFDRDPHGVSFWVSLPSGQIMMLAVSQTPKVELFGPEPFPGLSKDQAVARCKELAGGSEPPAVVLLNGQEIRPWLERLTQPMPVPEPARKGAPRAKAPLAKQPVVISYGEEFNQTAAEKLAAFLHERFGLETQLVRQATQVERKSAGDQNGPEVDYETRQVLNDFEKPLVFIGDEWTNNDLAIAGCYFGWGSIYNGPHLPFTSNYVWPGKGRAVVALSRRYALIDANGKQINGGRFSVNDTAIRPVEDRFGLLRRKLHIAANGEDAVKAVEAVIEMVSK